jgi:AbrB family looped-hinge helix DNA binding protein
MTANMTTLTSKGQITLTKAIRDRLVLKKGDRLRISISPDGSVTLRREQEPHFGDAFGILHRLARRRPPSVSEMRAAVRQRMRRKAAGERA